MKPAADTVNPPAGRPWRDALRFRADSELFLLDPRTGEPFGHPEEAYDLHRRFGREVEEVLRADTGGAVLVLRNEYRPVGGPFDVLTTDPPGEGTARGHGLVP